MKELQRIRAQSGDFFTVDIFDLQARDGLSMEGRIEPIGRVRGKEAARRLSAHAVFGDSHHTGHRRAHRHRRLGVFYQNEDGTNPETQSYD